MVRVSRRLILWLAGGLIGVLVLAVVLVLIAITVVDPDRYKGTLARIVRTQTGRELALPGTLSWRILPWPVVSVGEGSLSDPAGDSRAGTAASPFARWRRMRLGMKLAPLLRRQLVFDAIAVEGLQLDLRRDAGGRGNWTFDGGDGTQSAQRTLQIDAIELRDATVTYSDAATGARWRMSSLDLSARIPAGVTLQDPSLQGLELQGVLSGPPLPAAGLAMELDVPKLSYRSTEGSAEDRLDVPEWRASAAGARVDGALSLRIPDDAPLRGSGTVRVRTQSLRESLAATGVAVPRTRDAGVLGELDLQAGFGLDAGALRIEPLKLHVDDTRIAGTAGLASLEQRALEFALAGDSIVIDRYLQPQDAGGEPFELPIAQLKALRARGTLTLESAELAGTRMRGVRVELVDGELARPAGAGAQP